MAIDENGTQLTGNRAAPLGDIRVLAIEQFGAGPFCSLYLADAGAEVIKIEDPGQGGDVGRTVPPVIAGDSSLYFETFNRGKRSIALDLKNPAGQSVFERLARTSDVVFNNLRGDLPEVLGLTYGHLFRHNPQIVCASLSGYGRTGDRASSPGYDALIQAETGWAMLTGEPGGPPVKSGLSLIDFAAGLACAVGILAAVIDARRTGIGRDVDTSLFDVGLSLLTYRATWFLSAGIETERNAMSAHPSIVPFQFFQTSDGYIAIACAKEKFFESLVRVLDVPQFAVDPRFRRMWDRMRHGSELVSELQELLSTGTTAHWLRKLDGVVPCAPVRSMEEALEQEDLNAGGRLIEYDHPQLGAVRSLGTPIRYSDFAAEPHAAPSLGQARLSLLEEIGINAKETRALERLGAFGRSNANFDD
jgi:crotonobetainyl-CoA:carnitine CoA-transferase CaiB-like acyl-CoA transferase